MLKKNWCELLKKIHENFRKKSKVMNAEISTEMTGKTIKTKLTLHNRISKRIYSNNGRRSSQNCYLWNCSWTCQANKAIPKKILMVSSVTFRMELSKQFRKQFRWRNSSSFPTVSYCSSISATVSLARQ